MSMAPMGLVKAAPQGLYPLQGVNKNRLLRSVPVKRITKFFHCKDLLLLGNSWGLNPIPSVLSCLPLIISHSLSICLIF